MSLAPAAGGGGTRTSFSFGRVGGNIEPFTVNIGADGSVSASGPVKPKKQHVGAATLAALTHVVAAQQFFSLPTLIRCPGTLPDVASNTVTVRTAARSRTVVEHGGCSVRFRRVYNALAGAVGVEKNTL